MTTITISGLVIYIIMTVFLLIVLMRYKRDFDAKNLIDSFIYLTNKTTILYLFFTFLILTIYGLTNYNEDKLYTFIQEMFRGLVYYAFFSYGLLYLIKSFYYWVNFFKETDLFNFSMLSKEAKKTMGWNKK